jgi:hypothetical protein
LTTAQLATLQDLVERTGLPDPNNTDAISELTERALIFPPTKSVLVKRWVEKRLELAASRSGATEQWLINTGNGQPAILAPADDAMDFEFPVPSSFGPDGQPPTIPTPSPPAGAQPNREQEQQIKERLVCQQ